VRETTEQSQNYGYKFGQEEETYNIVAARSCFDGVIFQYASFDNGVRLHFFLAWPVIGIVYIGHQHHGLQPERLTIW